ncbi:hypothetical protein BD626DRAFT_532765 [Schizophyllum amplum]|uniref:Uncharacterized protein n=1 Tax=Schizophyllum amplum TaxID=97359 RepID=A0A550CVM6_9AGAR|nr:hypothetical protein BD626DRAFT_532765 [Auriculariopsis ampla]
MTMGRDSAVKNAEVTAVGMQAQPHRRGPHTLLAITTFARQFFSATSGAHASCAACLCSKINDAPRFTTPGKEPTRALLTIQPSCCLAAQRSTRAPAYSLLSLPNITHTIWHPHALLNALILGLLYLRYRMVTLPRAENTGCMYNV